MKIRFICILGFAFLLAGCSKFSPNPTLGGSQSSIGEVDNTFTFSNVSGLSNVSAVITELTGGVSKLTYTAQITETKLLSLAQSLSDATVSGANVTRSREYKITTKGIQSIYPEGKLILVDYDAKVGDKYSLKRGSATLTREVVSKSTEDDYFWGGMFIKTIKVQETGRNLPGVSKIEYVANHRFGLVGVKILFEDGTSKEIDIFSTKTN